LKYHIPFYWHPGFSLHVNQVPDDFRGPAMPPLARRIARDGILNVAVIGEAAASLNCVFRGIPPAIPIESRHQFRRKASSGRSEATLELESFPKWMASVNQEAHFLSHRVS